MNDRRNPNEILKVSIVDNRTGEILEELPIQEAELGVATRAALMGEIGTLMDGAMRYALKQREVYP